MPTTFDLRLATLRAAYREGRATPRQLVAELRDKAAALNPDYHLFIHLLTLEELEPYLAALDEKSPDSLPLYGIPFAAARARARATTPPPPPCRSTASPSPSRTTSTSPVSPPPPPARRSPTRRKHPRRWCSN